MVIVFLQKWYVKDFKVRPYLENGILESFSKRSILKTAAVSFTALYIELSHRQNPENRIFSSTNTGNEYK